MANTNTISTRCEKKRMYVDVQVEKKVSVGNT